MSGILQAAAAGGDYLLAPITRTYNVAGTGVETIPYGATTMIIEAWGGTGPGGSANTSTPGGGGGSGGYCKTVLSVAGQGGKTINYTVGPAQSSSIITSGTFAIATMTAELGLFGNGLVPGAGGVPTGGNTTNTDGNAGANPAGGAGLVGTFTTGNPGGAGGAVPSGVGNPGQIGTVVFNYV